MIPIIATFAVQIRNTKSEIRNKSEIQISNVQNLLRLQHFSHLKFEAKTLNRQDAKVAKQNPTEQERAEINASEIRAGRNSLKFCASLDLLFFLALLASWRFTPFQTAEYLRSFEFGALSLFRIS